MSIAPEANHAPLAAQDNLTGRKGELETQHDPLGPGLYAHEYDARARERFEVVLEIFFLAGVGTRDADR
jgi:hypothetical protein